MDTFSAVRAEFSFPVLAVSWENKTMSPGHSLAPSFLVAMPQLKDSNFERSVVLLCKHNDEGAFGLVLNRPLLTTGRVVVTV